MAPLLHGRTPPSEVLAFIMHPASFGLSASASNGVCRCSNAQKPSRAAFSTREPRRLEDSVSQASNLPDMPSPSRSPGFNLAVSPVKDSQAGLTRSSRRPPKSALTGTPDDSPPERDRSKDPRLPRSVQAIYLKPLKRKAQYGVPSCDLQLRSYNVRNVEFFADFALRAAYYLGLPAAGPVPLPRMTERWTVPRSNFIYKKSQENFERITLRRLIQIQDGHPEIVELWLAFLRKHAYYGVGIKANVWRHEKLGVGKTMDVSLENVKRTMEPKWAHFGRRKTLETSERAYEMMKGQPFEQEQPMDAMVTSV